MKATAGVAKGARKGDAMTDQLRLFNEPQREYTSDDYWTPKWLFDALEIEFDLDVACPPEGPPPHTLQSILHTRNRRPITTMVRQCMDEPAV